MTDGQFLPFDDLYSMAQTCSRLEHTSLTAFKNNHAHQESDLPHGTNTDFGGSFWIMFNVPREVGYKQCSSYSFDSHVYCSSLPI